MVVLLAEDCPPKVPPLLTKLKNRNDANPATDTAIAIQTSLTSDIFTGFWPVIVTIAVMICGPRFMVRTIGSSTRMLDMPSLTR